MGRIARLLSFVRSLRRGSRVSDVKVNPGGGPNITAQHFSDAGDDAHPLTSDYVALSTDAGTGRETAVGYLDPINEPKALEGDKRIYGRDPNTGASVVEVWLRGNGTAIVSNANGSVTVRPDGGAIIETPISSFECTAAGGISGSNGVGSFELQSGGTFFVNGVTIDVAGNISSPATISAPNIAGTTSVAAAGSELAGHIHPAGDPPGNTGPNI